MTAIAKWLIGRGTTPAQSGIGSLPGLTATAGINSQITRYDQWSIGYQADLQLSALFSQPLTLLTDCAIILELAGFMAVIAKWFIF